MTSIQIGERFGGLTALKEMQPAPHAYWFCVCDCGNTGVFGARHLNSGHTQSCGCLRTSRCHEYDSWRAMKIRCLNTKHEFYHRYGGRGIKVCDRWLNSFPNFLEDMGTKPTPEHSIERMDNDDNYEPDNCVWATKLEQANNKSNNKFVEGLDGELVTISQAARSIGISTGTLWSRLNSGMTITEASTKSILEHYTYGEFSLTLPEWAVKLNIPRHVLWLRLYRLGWSVEKTLGTPMVVYQKRNMHI